MREVAAASLILLTACSSAGDSAPQIRDARIGAPAGPHAALYLTVAVHEPDRLVGASTEVARAVELHLTSFDNDGMASMRPEEAFPVEPGQDLVLEPGGGHLMLLDVEPLAIGESVEVRLEFERAGTVVVEATVVDQVELAE